MNKEQLITLARISEEWLDAEGKLRDIEVSMREPYGILMNEVETLQDLQDIVDVMPKTCRITRRVYEAMIRMEDEKLVDKLEK